MAARDPEAPPARARPPRRRRRKLTLGAALVLAAAALVAGVVVGMGMSGGGDGRVTTMERTVNVVPVTPGR